MSATVGGELSGTGQAPEWRWALPRIGALFLATRLLLLAIAIVVEITQPPPHAGVRWTDAPLLASLTAYDGRYYLGIAAGGYHAAPVFGPYVDYVFFPLYPLLVRVGSFLTFGNIDLAGVLVANAAFAGALIALYALSIRHMTRDAALWSLVFLSLAPGAVAFAMAYTDSLFLLLAVAAFLAAETRRPALTGALLALATLTRPPGVLLVIPLLVLVLRDPEMRARRAWAWLILGPLALGAFSLYIGGVTGDPLAWLHGQSIWTRPVVVVLGDPSASPVPAGASGFAWEDAIRASYAAFTIWLGSILFYMFLFVYFRPDGMPLAYWLVAMLPYAGLVVGGRIMSASRFLAVAWPFDWTLARRRRRWVRVVIPAAFIALQCYCAWLAFTWTINP